MVPRHASRSSGAPGQEALRRAGEETVEAAGEARLGRGDQLGVAAAGGTDDLAGGAARADRGAGQVVEQVKEGELGLVLALHERVDVRSSAHQARRDRRHADAFFGQLAVSSPCNPSEKPTPASLAAL
jgi:hypothetical protein